MLLFQKKEKGNLRVHKLNNVEQAMKLLEKQKVTRPCISFVYALAPLQSSSYLWVINVFSS